MNHRLTNIIKLGTLDEEAFERDCGKVKAMTGIPHIQSISIICDIISADWDKTLLPSTLLIDTYDTCETENKPSPFIALSYL